MCKVGIAFCCIRAFGKGIMNKLILMYGLAGVNHAVRGKRR